MVHARPIKAEERIFSLVLGLIGSQYGLTKRELLSSVFGYSQRYDHSGDNSALDRMFERDKEAVRKLGIPIQTLVSPEEPENNQLTRYRISKDQLQIPADLTFTATELSLLRAGALAWSEGSLSEESRLAVMKLESLGAGIDHRLLGIIPNLGLTSTSARVIQDAIELQLNIKFYYQLPNAERPYPRHVSPLQLHHADGRWHLIAWDVDRSDSRVFLLSRITSPVTTTKTKFAPGLHETVEHSIVNLLQLGAKQVAELVVAEGSIAHSRLLPRACENQLCQQDHAGSTDTFEYPLIEGSVVMRVHTLDWEELAKELVSLDPDVLRIAPEFLRTRVLCLYQQMFNRHSAGEADD